MSLRLRVRNKAFSFSRSISPTKPPEVATATSVLLKGLQATEVIFPDADSLITMVLLGPEGRVVSYTMSCFPHAIKSLVLACGWNVQA